MSYYFYTFRLNDAHSPLKYSFSGFLQIDASTSTVAGLYYIYDTEQKNNLLVNDVSSTCVLVDGGENIQELDIHFNLGSVMDSSKLHLSIFHGIDDTILLQNEDSDIIYDSYDSEGPAKMIFSIAQMQDPSYGTNSYSLYRLYLLYGAVYEVNVCNHKIIKVTEVVTSASEGELCLVKNEILPNSYIDDDNNHLCCLRIKDYIVLFSGSDNTQTKNLQIFNTVDGTFKNYVAAVRYEYQGATMCFATGTQVCSVDDVGRDREVPVESLVAGDLVRTHLHGYRYVTATGAREMTNYSPDDNCMHILRRADEGLGAQLTADQLVMTGFHSVLLDPEDPLARAAGGERVDDLQMVRACRHPEFERAPDGETFTYHAFVLDNDGDARRRYGVWANGLLVESSSQHDFDAYFHGGSL